MNLKANYERFFGKIESKPEPKNQKLSTENLQRFTNISHNLGQRYPNAPITLKEGFVWFGYKKIEKIEDFLKKTNVQIHEQVRSFSNSGKTGLY